METEQKLADMVFGRDPVEKLRQLVDLKTEPDFLVTDQKQFSLFYFRLVKRMEERLSQQFGACLALIEEKTGLNQEQVAKEFLCSPEYRLVREDMTDAIQSSPSRLEIAFLHFILRTQENETAFLEEFSEIYLRELAMQS